MAVNSGNTIKAADYNSLQSRISEILGNGSADFGYGQSVDSSPVTPLTDKTIPNGNSVTQNQIQNLLDDFDTVNIHQNGEPIDINDYNIGDIIGADASADDLQFDASGTRTFVNQDTTKGVNDFYDIIGSLETNRLSIANNQLASQTVINDASTRDWSDTVDSEFTVQFSSANERRYFFNAGGRITIEGTVDLSTSTGYSFARDSGWKDIIENPGSIRFSANGTSQSASNSGISFPDNAIGNYQLTGSYQTIIRKDASAGLYSNSYWEIQARENSPSEIEFRVELVNRGPESNIDAGDPGSEPDGIRELVTATINLTYGFEKADEAVVVSIPTFNSTNTFDPNQNELFIATPSNQSPSNNQSVPTNTGVELLSSQFTPVNDTDNHEKSQWILRRLSDNEILVNDETTTQLTGYLLDSTLFDDVRGSSADYEWQVRYKGENTDWTPWSSATTFVTSIFAGFNIVLENSVRDYDLRLAIVNDFNWNETQRLQGTLTIAEGTVVGATSTDDTALEVSNFPTGSIITIQNNGRITGAGGDGADAFSTSPSAGESGGPALTVSSAEITMQNGNGIIAGGGGGGGAGYDTETYREFEDGNDADGTQITKDYYASGGGGAGDIFGQGGGTTSGSSGSNIVSGFGESGSLTSGGSGSTATGGVTATGGAGGNPGEPGQPGSSSSGGSVGNAITGIANITFASGEANVQGPTS